MGYEFAEILELYDNFALLHTLLKLQLILGIIENVTTQDKA